MNIISYSLFIPSKSNVSKFGKYITGALETVKTRDEFFPDWYIFIYCDETVFRNKYSRKLLDVLGAIDKLIVISMANLVYLPTYIKAGYRFLAMQDSRAEIILFRDLDSPLTQRDAQHVKEWMQSDATVLTYECTTFDSVWCKEHKLLKHVSHSSKEDWINTSEENLMSAGGTAVNMKKLKNSVGDYMKFIDDNIADYMSRYSDRLDARGFDEHYLYSVLGNESVDHIAMFMIISGKNRGKWFEYKDEYDNGFKVSKLGVPILDFIGYSNAKNITNILHQR